MPRARGTITDVAGVSSGETVVGRRVKGRRVDVDDCG
jgi:hypothetical protein